jgi:hypothetical protein
MRGALRGAGASGNMTTGKHVSNQEKPSGMMSQQAATPAQSLGQAKKDALPVYMSIGVVMALMIWNLFGLHLLGVESDAGDVRTRVLISLAPLIIGSLLGKLAYIIAGRSNWTGNIVFSLIIGVVLTGTVMKDVVSARNDRNLGALRDIERLAGDVQSSSREQLESKGYIEYDEDDVRRANQQLQDIASSLQGDERIIVEEIAKINANISQHALALQKATDTCTEAGSFDPATIRSREALAERRAMFEGMRDANEALTEAVRSVRTDLERRLRERNMSMNVRTAAVNQAVLGMNTPLLLRIRESDRVLATTAIEILNLLEANWGQWEIDPADGMTIWTTDAQVAQHNELIEAILEAAAEQERLQREYFEMAPAAATGGGG